MNVLAIDIGGNHVKVLATGQSASRRSFSGPTLTADQMVNEVKQLVADWQYSIGYPGPVVDGRIAGEPHNLGSGWVGFDFEKAFGRPVKVINDAAMQALGSYHGGTMLFLGLGTGSTHCRRSAEPGTTPMRPSAASVYGPTSARRRVSGYRPADHGTSSPRGCATSHRAEHVGLPQSPGLDDRADFGQGRELMLVDAR
ncbi:MAG: ROK family protein [Vulcanimicrobiaceae bacterium]